MKIKNFKLNIILRLLIISLLIGLLIYFLLVNVKYLRSAYIGVALILAFVEFVWYVDRTNRDFTAFLLALLQNDFTTTFSESNKGKSFNRLYTALNQITQQFKKLSSARQAQHLYLAALVEHVKVGILSFDEKEKVHLMNGAIKSLLDTSNVLYLKSIESIDSDFVNTLRTIEPGDQQLQKITINNNLLQLSIHASTFKLQDTYYKLVSIQNIRNELEANELDAWQKLIRVLTHEIMNSVTPISSLTETLLQIAQQEQKKTNPDPAIFNKLIEGLDAISSRSSGLQNFTSAYRSLTKIPTPHFEKVEIESLLKRIETLLADDLKAVSFTIYLPKETTHIIADPHLLDQVFINLIKNALDAVRDNPNPSITISVFKKDKVSISVADNGSGITQDKLDKIFVPFFTTKEKGSGIGLALSRQIIRLHNGSITVTSTPAEGSTFVVTL